MPRTSEGITTRASKRRRISIPAASPQTRDTSPDELGDDESISLVKPVKVTRNTRSRRPQRMTSVVIQAQSPGRDTAAKQGSGKNSEETPEAAPANMHTNDHNEDADSPTRVLTESIEGVMKEPSAEACPTLPEVRSPSQPATSEDAIGPPQVSIPSPDEHQGHDVGRLEELSEPHVPPVALSPPRPMSYSPVTQPSEESEKEVTKAETQETKFAPGLVIQETESDPSHKGTPFGEDFRSIEDDPRKEDDMLCESIDMEGQDIPRVVDNTPEKTQTSYRTSFSERARYNSKDIKPEKSMSPPPYSRISTPIATPEPAIATEAVYLPYEQKLVLKGHKRGVAAVRFSPDGRLIASCSADATIRIWDTETGKHLRTFEGHMAGISTLSWSPDSKTIASGSDDKSIRIWDVPTGKPHPHPLIGHHNYIYSIAFSPKGNILVSGSYDEAVFLWDVRTRRILKSLPAHSDPVGGVDFVRDGTLIASCAGDGLIRIWDAGTGQCLRTLVHEDNAPVTSVRFSPNGKYVLAWTLDSSIRLWDYVEGRCVKTYQGHTNQKFSVGGAFGVYNRNAEANGTEKAFVVSGSEDGDVMMWDVVSKVVLQRIKAAHHGVVLGVDTYTGRAGREMIVTGGLDKTVRIWERRLPEEAPNDMAVSADEEIVFGGDQGTEESEAPIQAGHDFLQVPVRDEI